MPRGREQPTHERRHLDDIAALSDLPSRNYLITSAYHRLSHRVGELLGHDDANWMTVAAWSSEQVGKFIRCENIPLSGLDWCLLRELSAHFIDGAPYRTFVAGATSALAAANAAIFGEIAPAFLFFVEQAPAHDRVVFSRRFERYLRDQAAPGEAGGALLLTAFELYYKGYRARSDEARSQYVFLGNAYLAMREQSRLDEWIARSLSFEPAGRAAQRLGLYRDTDVLAASRRLFTRLVLSLQLPRERVRLGSDLPPRKDGSSFAPTLRRFDALAPEDRQYVGPVLALCRDPESLQGTAATDWSKLDERMNFIIGLFRSRQRDRELFLDPLDEAHVALRHRASWHAERRLWRLTDAGLNGAASRLARWLRPRPAVGVVGREPSLLG